MDRVVEKASPSLRDRLFDGSRCFVIAEAGVNHNGDPATAFELVDAAAGAQADAVKFQTFRAEKLVSRGAPKAAYQVATTGSEDSQFEMLKRLELSEDVYAGLQSRASENGTFFMSTPFDEDSADFLDGLGMEAFKIGSSELTNLEMLRHIGSKDKPVLLSTGMGTLDEVEIAIDAVRAGGAADIIVLHCVSNYPTDPKDVNLRAMQTMADAFGLPVGLSDHTMGNDVAIAAVALGATVIEKHFTLDCEQDGPDHRASLDPDGMRRMVDGIRRVEAALGDGVKRPAPSEADVAAVARRSLIVAVDLPAGAILTPDVLVARRPGSGLPPSEKPRVVGRTLRVDAKAGTVLELEMLS